MQKQIKLKRLEDIKQSAGITWGVPWKKGSLENTTNIYLKDMQDNFMELQSWPTAYWPDGSIKWTAHSAYFKEGLKKNYYLVKKEKEIQKAENDSKKGIGITEEANLLQVDTGKIKVIFNKSGSKIIESIKNKKSIVAEAGQLECVLEKREAEYYYDETYFSTIEELIVEASGPLRAVIRVEGRHQLKTGKRKWLPFKLRFYLYYNSEEIKVKQTYIFDGNSKADFIKNLSFKLKVPLAEKLHNRNLRFAGDSGVFSETPQLLPALRLNKYQDLYKKQIAGKKIEINNSPELISYLEDMPVWNDYQLVQDAADHYLIKKRTKKECSWVTAAHGLRSGGLAYLSSGQGGLALGLRDFWQKHPSSLEIKDLSKEKAEMRLSFWGAEDKVMDLRHYDTETHAKSSYEGFDELRSTPNGIGNTGEFRLWILDYNPEHQKLMELAAAKNRTQLLVCEPEYYQQTEVFSGWSLPDRSSPLKSKLEKLLEAGIEFYQNEIETRKWYGFWNYGDIMHSYDPIRHSWRYDMGGYAWQNTELVPNMWLWYSFLRTGKKEIFQLAESMTRHTSEVDTYHLGEYSGLGSRHNVVHWGCGCKEARISMAGLNRFYYFLTADERIGEIMDQVKDADYMTEKLNPMRNHIEDDQYPTYVRSGPDWTAFCSNWLAQWERYQDQSYQNKILKGIDSLAEMPHGFCSGPAFGYRADEGELFHIGDENYSYHMIMPFGGLQILINLLNLTGNKKLEQMMIDFGSFYYLSDQEKSRQSGGDLKGSDWSQSMLNAGIAAFAAAKKDDRKLMLKAWQLLLNEKQELFEELLHKKQIDSEEYIKVVREIKEISTNFISQWSLNVIFALKLTDDTILEDEKLFLMEEDKDK